MQTIKPFAAVLAATALTFAAGCSQESAYEGTDIAEEAAADWEQGVVVEAPHADLAPGMTTSAAPGVAFAYRYAFTLPGDAISDVQHRHAAACEELGAEQCQITGMDYRQDSPGSIEARLDFLVARQIAHRFGNDALDAVRNAEGTLEDATVTGDNVGGQIENSQVLSAGLEAELARIEKRLEMPGLSRDERQSLSARANDLRSSLQRETQVRADGEKRLATVPMSFAYSSEGLFAPSGDPLGKAAASSLGSMETMLAVLLTLAGIALPWSLLAGLLFLAWKGLRRTVRSAATDSASVP